MKPRRDILSYYPYATFRPGHKEALQYLQSQRSSFDAAIIVAPTGSGKTSLRRAIAGYFGDSVMLVPTNALISQELQEFPDTNAILSMESGFYQYPTQQMQALARCQRRGVPILCVPHMMLARRLQRRTMIVDEGHKFIDFNKELQAIHAWRREIGYPATTYSRRDFESYLQGQLSITADPKRRGKIQKLLEKLLTDDYMVKREKALYHGRWEDRISLIPMSPSLHPSIAYSGGGQIILLSATVNHLDVRDLGIGEDKRVVKIELPSAIPPDSRPLVRAFVGSLNQNNISSMAPLIAGRIKELAEFHEGQKGLVHVTYQLSTLLRPYLSDQRFLFHEQWNSKSVLNEWQLSSDKVFIAAGFEEGLDLKGDDYQWQAIAKVQYPSLGDSAIRRKAQESDEWYQWSALRKVIQAYGRISRSETDFGVTYILDEMFDRLIEKCNGLGLIPTSFREVI